MKLLVAAVLAVSCLPAQQMAEQTYKNIVELKGAPADQVGPAMQFISSSLGVECGFCHVPGKPEADDKPEKKTARQMIAMTKAINQTHFGGRLQVTCNSCHNGATRPVSIPPVMQSDTAPAKPAQIAPATANVDQILDHYVTAVGGADAIHKMTSRLQKGVIRANGAETPIEVLTKAPNKRLSTTHGANGDSMTAFDGTAGWMGGATGGAHTARPMSAVESASSALDAEFYLALRLKELYPQLRRGRAELVDGAECDVLNGTAAGRPAVRLYFDRKSGLLARLVRYTETPLGRNPVQVDYADYRAVNGVRIPHRWTLSRTNGRFTIQINETQANVAIDDAKFARPASGDGR
jgi:photosynthetic reaction center cytochrome c subunit